MCVQLQLSNHVVFSDGGSKQIVYGSVVVFTAPIILPDDYKPPCHHKKEM